MQTTPPIESPYLTADEAAAYLKFPTTHWFRAAVRRYGIPCLRRGKRLFFTKAALDAYMTVAHEPTASRGRKKRTKAA